MKMLSPLKIVIFVIALSVFAVPAFSADAVKIGFVDLQEALNKSKAGKEAREVFKTEVDGIQKKLDGHQKDLKKMKEELENQGLLLSEETKLKREKEYQDKLKTFQRLYQDSQEKLRERDAELTKKVLNGLQKVIEEIGRQDGYTVILEKNESHLLYAPESIDLTPELIRRANEGKK